MADEKQKQLLEDGDKLAPFFQVEVTIRVLGHVIWHYVFPPRKNV